MPRAFIPSPSQPLVDENGVIAQPWYDFLLFLSGGSGSGSILTEFVGDTTVNQEITEAVAPAALLSQADEPVNVASGDDLNSSLLLSEDTHARSLGHEALDAVALRTLAGYGAIRQTLSPALPDIAVGFQTLPADAGSSGAGQRGVTAIVANDAIRFDEPGVWLLSISFALDFIDAPQGRTFDIRAYNITSATAGRTVQVAVGRNQSGVNWSAGFLVSTSGTASEIRIEIGNASATIAGVTLISYSFDAVRVSEKRG